MMGDGCQQTARSARGYCPGQPGHGAEREGLFLDAETTTVQTSEPPRPPTLPETGIDLPTGLVTGLLFVAVGILAVRRAS